MAYTLPDPLPWLTLASPLAAAEDALARLDARLGTSSVRAGWISRTHFADACASLWLKGELVPLEDLVLHDGERDVRTPTHEITRAHAVLRARRRIAAAEPGWALRAPGLSALCQEREVSSPCAPKPSATGPRGTEEPIDDDALAAELAAVDALIERSSRTLDGAIARRESEGLVYDGDWDEAERLEEWRWVLDETRHLPPVLAAAVACDAWWTIEPLQHRSWLGPLLCAAHLRARGKARHHLPCLNSALKTVPWERRRARDRTVRLTACLDAIAAGAGQGIKDLERWELARTLLLRKVGQRRRTSKLPRLVDLVLARGMVSASSVADELGVTARAALDLIGELGLRELTGRGRYRVWGVI